MGCLGCREAGPTLALLQARPGSPEAAQDPWQSRPSETEPSQNRWVPFGYTPAALILLFQQGSPAALCILPLLRMHASVMLAGCITCLKTRAIQRHCHTPGSTGTAYRAPRHAGHAQGAIAGGFVRAWQEAPCDSQQLDATLYCAVQRKCEVWFFARQGCTAAKSPARPRCTTELNHCELGDHHSSWPTHRQRPQHTHHSKACVVCSWAAPNCQQLPIGLDTDPVNTISNANQAAPPEPTALPDGQSNSRPLVAKCRRTDLNPHPPTTRKARAAEHHDQIGWAHLVGCGPDYASGGDFMRGWWHKLQQTRDTPQASVQPAR